VVICILTPRACFGGADEDEAAVSSRNMGGGGGAATKGEPEEVMVAKEESHKKEVSVLQAKLTKLAIQIGYAGTDTMLFLRRNKVRAKIPMCVCLSQVLQ
jgi:hypothetical protein